MPAIKVHHTKTSEGAWDGPANKARLKADGDEAYYRQAFAWQDEGGDPTTKAAYKFIHHDVSEDGTIGAANLRACSTGIGVLNGGRGGTTIPDSDVQGVYRHLAAHLQDADQEPPELTRDQDDEKIERRLFAIEMRAAGDGQAPAIEGYAAVFDQLSESMWGFRERIRPGAFANALLGSDVVALFNHDANYVLGRQSSNTLELREDDKGLFFRVVPPETSWSSDLIASMKRGDIKQCSFAFTVIDETWTEANGQLLRDLLQVDLYDVSVVTFPAYPQTSAQVRARVKENRNHEEPEDAGESRTDDQAALERNQVRRKKIRIEELRIRN